MTLQRTHDQQIEYETMTHDQAMEKLRMSYWMRGQIWAGCISSVAIGGSVAALFAGANALAVGIISTEFVALMALFLRRQNKKD